MYINNIFTYIKRSVIPVRWHIITAPQFVSMRTPLSQRFVGPGSDICMFHCMHLYMSMLVGGRTWPERIQVRRVDIDCVHYLDNTTGTYYMRMNKLI